MIQPGLFDGEARKAEGRSRVESKSADFLFWARDYAAFFCRMKPSGTVTTDDIREASELYDQAPHHRNAWGAIFKGSQWEAVGFQKSRIPGNHARRITIWRLRGER